MKKIKQMTLCSYKKIPIRPRRRDRRSRGHFGAPKVAGKSIGRVREPKSGSQRPPLEIRVRRGAQNASRDPFYGRGCAAGKLGGARRASLAAVVRCPGLRIDHPQDAGFVAKAPRDRLLGRGRLVGIIILAQRLNSCSPEVFAMCQVYVLVSRCTDPQAHLS